MLDLFDAFQQRFNVRLWLTISILLVVAILTYRHFALIHHHAVNLLYWDQWGFFDPLFIGKRWWEAFRWQHGPWRQGAGILSYLLAEQTNWDSRAESFFIGWLVWLAMLAALWLKWRLFGKLTAYDVTIPLIVLTPTQFQTYAGAVSSAPTTFPMLLIVLYCLAWTIERKFWRIVGALVLNFLLVNTGYGLFVGGITFALFAIESWNHRNRRPDLAAALSGLIVSALTIFTFVIDYSLEHFSGSVGHQVSRLWDYPLFAGLMLGRFVRPYPNRIGWFTYLAMLVGIGLLLLAIVALVIHLRRVLNQLKPDSRINLVVTILIGFVLLFVANAAWGRAGMGLNGSQSSRFVTLLIPGFLGLYFHLLTLQADRLRRIALSVFLLLMLPGHLPLRLGDNHPAGVFSHYKRAWKECYLRTEKVEHCTELVGFELLPAAQTDLLKARLKFLQEHKLNLYADPSH
ncbi:MAG: hypothetical protein ACKVZH_21005 [Blastocatellia bacterium]